LGQLSFEMLPSAARASVATLRDGGKAPREGRAGVQACFVLRVLEAFVRSVPTLLAKAVYLSHVAQV
jgi:hypothetical protein